MMSTDNQAIWLLKRGKDRTIRNDYPTKKRTTQESEDGNIQWAKSPRKL